MGKLVKWAFMDASRKRWGVSSVTMAPKFLITTADEQTWRFDERVIFLGDWCLKHSRQHIWGHMDHEIAAPYGLSQNQRDLDLSEVKRITSQLLEELTKALNKIHTKSHSSRYWNIILGNWLVRYVSTCYNRYSTILAVLEEHDISGTSVFRREKYSMVVSNSSQFVNLVNQSSWNNFLYFKVLDFIGFNKLYFLDANDIAIEDNTEELTNYRITTLKRLLKSGLTRLLPYFSRDSNALILNSYLPRIEEIKLQLRLLQIPQLHKPYTAQISPVDSNIRDALQISCDGHKGFEKFIRDLLPEVLPTCFLEGFESLEHAARSIGWPSKPKFIFTSNNFDTDELFKVWTSEKVEEGIPYYIGQHGNNYGTSKLSSNYPELQYSDRFITWGWSDGSPNVLPGFIFKVAKKPKSFDPNGGLLLISNCVDHMSFTYDSTHEFKNYQDGQFKFLTGLLPSIQSSTTVRLHAGWKLTSWEDDLRWRDQFPKIHLDLGRTPIDQLLGKNRLAVHSYDSTGILEGLASNVPTLAFWEGGFEHLLPEAKDYYQTLLMAGIIHLDSNRASALVNENWDDILEWWNSLQVQQARVQFCEKYAREESNPSKSLKKLLG